MYATVAYVKMAAKKFEHLQKQKVVF